MATLYITEYANVTMQAGTLIAVPEDPPITKQTVAIGGSSASSATLNAATRLVRLHCDAICSVLIGTSPTATATDGRFAANQTEFRGVAPNGGMKVAVITNS